MLLKQLNDLSHTKSNRLFYMRKKNLILYITSRLQIAALHFNENLDKSQRKVSKGENVGTGQWLVSYPKYRKGGAVAKEVKVPCTYGNGQCIQFPREFLLVTSKHYCFYC